MEIILTHEQADFDALASLFGAYLLDEVSIPVLPRRMNRNVRAFLTLYGADLPFVDPRDLPAEPIQAVTLVDTQSMVSVRGVSDSTRVRIIDHHPLREDLPADWMITVTGTGANTTLFVETIRDRDLVINSIQATLLLLGIYEDTGSLTYDRTTARDLRSAGYLLEQGASLQIASGFLNHPLSLAQQEIYELLKQNVESYVIHGHTILIFKGDAREVDEELSTIAHKLRDLMDPDALCLLVTTRGGVQLIARSTSSNIDVGQIAGYFGGGGHERAAASLIKDRSLDEVYAQLREILPQHVRPAIVVAQIMSTNPQVLSPESNVQEASERMQRYGYEGFPVVQSGKLVGLLTRRAVDRAVAHKYNVKVARLMDPGEYTVFPDDSIEHLQRLMTETGWGQVPVVDPEDGSIIGIVTRTDLIKALAPHPPAITRQNLADRLEKALPPARLAILKAVAQTAHQQHAALYIVGGFVRDLLLERAGIDFDLVVEGDAITLAGKLVQRFGGYVVSHGRFGTAKWFPDGSRRQNLIESEKDTLPSIDLVTARTEFYTHPSALPTVERGSIKLDLHRRDFTINTLALRLDGRHYGELYDYWGGLTDLHRGVVRVLHSLSFIDDPTRILRALRFEQRFGFHIESRTLDLLKDAIPLLDRVSGDRIRHELDNTLRESCASQIIARLDELGLLRAIHPELVWDAWLQINLGKMLNALPESEWGWGQSFIGSKEQREAIYCLWLMRLPSGQANSVISRLKFSAVLARIIGQAHTLWMERAMLVGAKPSQVVERLDESSLVALFAVATACDDPEVAGQIQQYLKHWRHLKPRISGDDLRSKGVPPGPAYREILKALRDARLNGQVNNDVQENAFLEKLLAKKLAG